MIVAGSGGQYEIDFFRTMCVFWKIGRASEVEKNMKLETIRCFKGRQGLIYGGIETYCLQEAF